MIESHIVNLGLAVPVFSLGDDPISCLKKAMAFLRVMLLVNLELPLIQETIPLFKMARSQCNKFRGDKGKVILVLVIRVMLLVLGETLQVDMKGLLNATTVKLKRPRNAAWYKDKSMLAEAQKARHILDEEKLTFLADPGIPDAVLMANISIYSYVVISGVSHFETYLNDMGNQSVHAMLDFDQTPVVDVIDKDITSDSNIF
nr:hypothetical protein [Tanacetum cinerariifolium]